MLYVPVARSQEHIPTDASLAFSRERSDGSVPYKINNRLTLLEYLVFLIDLAHHAVSDRVSELSINVLPLTSNSLNAARLFNPCTLASRENESLPCRLCHLWDDEEDEARRLSLVDRAW